MYLQCSVRCKTIYLQVVIERLVESVSLFEVDPDEEAIAEAKRVKEVTDNSNESQQVEPPRQAR